MTDVSVLPDPLSILPLAREPGPARTTPAPRADPLGYRLLIAVLALAVVAATRGAFACELRAARTVAELLVVLACGALGALAALVTTAS